MRSSLTTSIIEIAPGQVEVQIVQKMQGVEEASTVVVPLKQFFEIAVFVLTKSLEQAHG